MGIFQPANVSLPDGIKFQQQFQPGNHPGPEAKANHPPRTPLRQVNPTKRLNVVKGLGVQVTVSSDQAAEATTNGK